MKYKNFKQEENFIAAEYKTNTKAIIGFILGILSIFTPAIGLLFGIFGLVVSLVARKEIVKSGGKGDKLAIAGVILSIVGIVLQLFLTIAGILSLFQAPTG